MQSTTPIEKCFPNMKKAHRAALERLGIRTAHDLLYHLPHRYADMTGGGQDGDVVIGTIASIGMRRTSGRRRMMIAEATVIAEGERVRAVWFYQPYIAKQFQAGDVVTLAGSWAGKTVRYLANPIITRADAAAESGELTPFYPETHGVSSRWLQTRACDLLKSEGIRNIADPVPEDVRKRLHLPDLYDTLVCTHRPRNSGDHESARKRLIFEHVFLMQIRQQMTKHARGQKSAYPVPVAVRSVTSFMRDRFDFTPTKGQMDVAREITRDIKKQKPMARLLEGDVGSGKTAVAAAVTYGVVASVDGPERPQVAYLAPTDVLARQQFETLVRLLDCTPARVGYLSSRTCRTYPSKTRPDEAADAPKSRVKQMIQSGEIDVVVGTHAVIQKDIAFRNLALAIIDEQHRFGVAQRKHLVTADRKTLPHLLSMTATPIPRTLALAMYADLDISVLREMPAGRRDVRTQVVPSKDKRVVYNRIRREVDRGRQAYVLCPRIEEGDDSMLRSLEAEHRHLEKTVFPDRTIAMLHGRMKPKEKDGIMDAFNAGGIDIVVCTTVIEIGVDVPNATVMAILHAERFGLAQLHQIRGRVARSKEQSYCYAITDSGNAETLKRLRVFEKTSNGFDLAEQDLAMRGAGDLAGLRQSGLPDMVAEGLRNPRLVALARTEAQNIIRNDPTLAAHPTIREQLDRSAAGKA